MKLPVVVSDRVGLSREIVSADAGLVCEYGIDSIYSALLKMANDDNRSVKGERGHRLVASKYTWSRIADDLLIKLLN